RAAVVYGEAGDGLLWIGARDAALHAGAVLVAEASTVGAMSQTGDSLRLPQASGLRPWRPDAMAATRVSATAMRNGAARFVTLATKLGEPRGFGAWLLRIPMTFLLEAARPHVDELTAASAADHPARP